MRFFKVVSGEWMCHWVSITLWFIYHIIVRPTTFSLDQVFCRRLLCIYMWRAQVERRTSSFSIFADQHSPTALKCNINCWAIGKPFYVQTRNRQPQQTLLNSLPFVLHRLYNCAAISKRFNHCNDCNHSFILFWSLSFGLNFFGRTSSKLFSALYRRKTSFLSTSFTYSFSSCI